MAKKLPRDRAIHALNPNAQFVIINETVDSYDSIEWQNGTTEIPAEDIEAKLAELQAIEDNKEQSDKDLKASAKAKLIAGEALTEEEANTIII